MRLNHDCLEVFTGDALNRPEVSAALEGMDQAIQCLGIPLGLSMITKPVSLFSDATRVLVPEMEKAGVKRLVAITGFGAGDSESAISFFQRLPFKLVFGRAYEDKSIQEEIIRSSSLDWTIVRPGVLTNGPATQSYRVLPNQENWKNGIVSRADVADFIVGQIDDTSYLYRTPVIVGPSF
jgi:putative NADH-flavin reductase